MAVGDRLNNGATIVAENRLGDDRRVVLAVWRDGAEYVTWIVGNDGEAFWGHYFWGSTGIVEATADYVARGGLAAGVST